MRWVYAGELGPDGKLDWGGMPGGNIPERGMVPDLYATELYVLVRRLAWAGPANTGDVILTGMQAPFASMDVS